MKTTRYGFTFSAIFAFCAAGSFAADIPAAVPLPDSAESYESADYGVPSDAAETAAPAAVPAVTGPSIAKGKKFKWKLPLAKKQWTVMVYINGKNDLEGDALLSLNNMELVGSNEQLNIVTELGRVRGGPRDEVTAYDGDWAGIRRYYIEKDFFPENGSESAVSDAKLKAYSVINSPLIERDKRANMADYRHVVDFVDWAKKNFPAEHYMLVIWSHGSGWIDPKMKKTAAPDESDERSSGLYSEKKAKGVSLDSAKNRLIRTVEIRKILRDIGPVDILAMDACFMQMAEIAYDVRHLAKIYIASEEVVPSYSFDYAEFLRKLSDNPYATAEELSGYVVNTFEDFYAKYYENIQMPATLSAIRVSEMLPLIGKINGWVDAAMAANDLRALKLARNRVLRFDEFIGDGDDADKILSTYGDLYHFVELTAKFTKNAVLKQKSAELMNFIATRLVIKNAAVGESFIMRNNYKKNAHGLAINIPRIDADNSKDAGMANKYTDLSFSRSKWTEFYNWMSANVK